MENEIEDLVGDVRYTDSQKSVTTSNAYSPDFTDSSSDKNHSSSKDTYVIDWDDSDDSDKTFQIHHNTSMINLTNKIDNVPENKNLSLEASNAVSRSAGSSLHQCSILSQEIYTQTSKTIFELVANENEFHLQRESRTSETQTLVLCVTENKTLEYKTEVKGVSEGRAPNESINSSIATASSYNKTLNNNSNGSHDTSTKYPDSETHNETTVNDDSDSTLSDRFIQFIDAESDEIIRSKDVDKSSDLESSDIEEDSLMRNDNCHDISDKLDSISDTSVSKSVDNDVEELYNKISESIDLFSPEKSPESNLRRYGTLTPLTEETMPKKDSIIDVTPSLKSITKPIAEDTKKIPFGSKPIRPAASAENAMSLNKEKLKLPPIHKNKSCPNSPNLNFLFTINPIPQNDEQRIVEHRETLVDRWELNTKNLAGGESPLISGRSDPARSTNQQFHLPPIHVEGLIQNINNRVHYFTTARFDSSSKETPSIQESITIKEKIAELRAIEKKSRQATSRSGSPTSAMSPDEMRLCDIAERGSEALCGELLRKLRSSIWVERECNCHKWPMPPMNTCTQLRIVIQGTEVVETLEELPNMLDKFWNVLSETRIADLLRQVIVHVDSPRTQVARLACSTIAGILRNTHYTKKPDFNEALTALLTRTGSLSRPVRRAANVALDEIVSGVELSHTVTALCLHGVGHKSALVRCAAVRLIVVCCALAEGGRGLLRSRPPSAATARRLTLKALATLLDDKNGETRKYAERLYTMLRPLTNFEAYFLTDVDVETAARQMKRFDQILVHSPNTR